MYRSLSILFCAIVVISNILSAKMVPLFGLAIPAGLLLYPLSFLLSDLVTEIFGVDRAKRMVYLSLGITFFSFSAIQLVLLLPIMAGLQSFLSLSALRIFSSLTSYLVSQMVDIQLFALIKQWSGPKFLWLRNNGSTIVSQMVDTVMIDLIFLWWGLGMEMGEVVPIMGFSYLYKTLFSMSFTPLLYLLVFLIQRRYRVFIPKQPQNLGFWLSQSPGIKRS